MGLKLGELGACLPGPRPLRSPHNGDLRDRPHRWSLRVCLGRGLAGFLDNPRQSRDYLDDEDASPMCGFGHPEAVQCLSWLHRAADDVQSDNSSPWIVMELLLTSKFCEALGGWMKLQHARFVVGRRVSATPSAQSTPKNGTPAVVNGRQTALLAHENSAMVEKVPGRLGRQQDAP